jgi:hypothetical protein
LRLERLPSAERTDYGILAADDLRDGIVIPGSVSVHDPQVLVLQAGRIMTYERGYRVARGEGLFEELTARTSRSA